MTLQRMEAVFSCDGCNTVFSMDVDLANRQRDGLSMIDAGEEALRGGHVGRIGPSGNPSLQGNHHLCPKCTSIADELTSDRPTYDEVAAILKEKLD